MTFLDLFENDFLASFGRLLFYIDFFHRYNKDNKMKSQEIQFGPKFRTDVFKHMVSDSLL